MQTTSAARLTNLYTTTQDENWQVLQLYQVMPIGVTWYNWTDRQLRSFQIELQEKLGFIGDVLENAITDVTSHLKEL